MSLVDDFAVFVLAGREAEEVIADASRFELADADCGVEDANLDTHTDRVVGALVQQASRLLDALDALLRLQRHVVALVGVLDAVGVVVGVELELRGIFVALVAVGIVDGNRIFLALENKRLQGAV